MNGGPVCSDHQPRRDHARERDRNGIDYVEVDGLVLTLFFILKAPAELSINNFRIDGGVRIRNIKVVDIQLCRIDDPELDDCVRITVDRVGDFSTYTLRIVKPDSHGNPGTEPLDGFDRLYSSVEFSFRIECGKDFDCTKKLPCPAPLPEKVEIDYLIRDYEGFRQGLLDRLTLTMPQWTERSPADVGIVLVEILAYAADHLSYLQDAVATEAYLGTARRRTSVRRHVRLLDYRMSEGVNARAWVTVSIIGGEKVELLPTEFCFIAGYADQLGQFPPVIGAVEFSSIPYDSVEVFEPVVADRTRKITFYSAHDKIDFYTWGENMCCLPRGATNATLLDPGRKLKLQTGDVLIFEEVIGPKTGNPADADPTHRQAVCLTKAEPSTDQLFEKEIYEIAWSAEDALLFALCISVIGPPPDCALIAGISVARGNVVLVDHGRTLDPEPLGPVPTRQVVEACSCDCLGVSATATPGRFYPSLNFAPLTYAEPLPVKASVFQTPEEGAIIVPASGIMVQDPRAALPQIWLRQEITTVKPPVQLTWNAERDLIENGRDDRVFAVEPDDTGRAYLRFGNGVNGRAAEAGATFNATYRIGNGTSGNVGAGSISCMMLRNTLAGVDLRARNPLPASGAIDPEPVADVKLAAPHAFRSDLQRAITAEDYATLAERHPKVQRAAATLRWTGSWYEVLVAIDPLGSAKGDQSLLEEIEFYLHRYRRIGHDVRVEPAEYVPLFIVLEVCVKPDHVRGYVKRAVLDRLSSGVQLSGEPGFFHPDKLTFGQPVALSTIVAAAQAVDGVENVTVRKLERLGEGPNGEMAAGILKTGPLEVLRLDNDPSFPENGKLELAMRGGQ